MTNSEPDLQTRQDAYDHDDQLQALELCSCGETRGAHVRMVRRGEYVAPCALCPCNDFKPEDYVPLDNPRDTVTI